MPPTRAPLLKQIGGWSKVCLAATFQESVDRTRAGTLDILLPRRSESGCHREQGQTLLSLACLSGLMRKHMDVQAAATRGAIG